MKRCPECKRDYYDGTLVYCLDDGSLLFNGPNSAEGMPTAVLPVNSDEANPQTAPIRSTISGTLASNGHFPIDLTGHSLTGS